jgi:hypothetical protein
MRASIPSAIDRSSVSIHADHVLPRACDRSRAAPRANPRVVLAHGLARRARAVGPAALARRAWFASWRPDRPNALIGDARAAVLALVSSLREGKAPNTALTRTARPQPGRLAPRSRVHHDRSRRSLRSARRDRDRRRDGRRARRAHHRHRARVVKLRELSPRARRARYSVTVMGIVVHTTWSVSSVSGTPSRWSAPAHTSQLPGSAPATARINGT